MTMTMINKPRPHELAGWPLECLPSLSAQFGAGGRGFRALTTIAVTPHQMPLHRHGAMDALLPLGKSCCCVTFGAVGYPHQTAQCVEAIAALTPWIDVNTCGPRTPPRRCRRTCAHTGRRMDKRAASRRSAVAATVPL
jgi:hypothetical protein